MIELNIVDVKKSTVSFQPNSSYVEILIQGFHNLYFVSMDTGKGELLSPTGYILLSQFTSAFTRVTQSLLRKLLRDFVFILNMHFSVLFDISILHKFVLCHFA